VLHPGVRDPGVGFVPRENSTWELLFVVLERRGVDNPVGDGQHPSLATKLLDDANDLFVGEGSLVEITTRTLQGRLRLKPSPELTNLILGVIGKAQTLYGMTIHAFVFISTHEHFLLSPSSAGQLAKFMQFVSCSRRACLTDPFFNGSLDDFRVYKRALSKQEITALIAVR
jgi:hypothetical protein